MPALRFALIPLESGEGCLGFWVLGYGLWVLWVVELAVLVAEKLGVAAGIEAVASEFVAQELVAGVVAGVVGELGRFEIVGLGFEVFGTGDFGAEAAVGPGIAMVEAEERESAEVVEPGPGVIEIAESEVGVEPEVEVTAEAGLELAEVVVLGIEEPEKTVLGSGIGLAEAGLVGLLAALALDFDYLRPLFSAAPKLFTLSHIQLILFKFC